MITVGIVELISAIVGSAAVSTGVAAFFGRRKNNAEASMVLVEATLKWAEAMATRITSLEAHLQEREQVIEELQKRIGDLEAQLAKVMQLQAVDHIAIKNRV